MKRVSLIPLALLLAFLSLSPALCEGQSTEIMKMLMTMTVEERAAFAGDFADFMKLIGEDDALPGKQDTPPAPETRTTLQGTGFASAQDAMIAFLEALSAGDYASACACYAIESLVDHASDDFLQRETSSVGSFYVTPLGYSGLLLPSESYREWNIAVRYTAVTSSTMAAAFYLAQLANPAMDKSGFPADLLLQWMNRGYDESAAERTASSLQLFEISDFSLNDFRAKELSFDDLEEWPDYKKSFMEKYGAQDVTCAALQCTAASGQDLVFIQYAVQYDGAWYLYGAHRFLTGSIFASNGGIYLKEKADGLF